ncbi:MAG TPA: hypothetical protein V6C91_06830 [Coleofasciculaceae cyanobacterium]
MSSPIYTSSPVSNSQPTSTQRTAVIEKPDLTVAKKMVYQADQQVKYLHLQAEVDSLLQQLQLLKQQRLASSAFSHTGNQG